MARRNRSNRSRSCSRRTRTRSQSRSRSPSNHRQGPSRRRSPSPGPVSPPRMARQSRKVTPTLLSKSLSKEFLNPRFADMVLICDDDKIHCHRILMAVRSPVFRTMIEQKGFTGLLVFHIQVLYHSRYPCLCDYTYLHTKHALILVFVGTIQWGSEEQTSE